jgi:hypothetical protein
MPLLRVQTPERTLRVTVAEGSNIGAVRAAVRGPPAGSLSPHSHCPWHSSPHPLLLHPLPLLPQVCKELGPAVKPGFVLSLSRNVRPLALPCRPPQPRQLAASCQPRLSSHTLSHTLPTHHAQCCHAPLHPPAALCTPGRLCAAGSCGPHSRWHHGVQQCHQRRCSSLCSSSSSSSSSSRRRCPGGCLPCQGSEGLDRALLPPRGRRLRALPASHSGGGEGSVSQRWPCQCGCPVQ